MIIPWSRNGDEDERSDHDANLDQQELERIPPLAMWYLLARIREWGQQEALEEEDSKPYWPQAEGYGNLV